MKKTAKVKTFIKQEWKCWSVENNESKTVLETHRETFSEKVQTRGEKRDYNEQRKENIFAELVEWFFRTVEVMSIWLHIKK